MQDDGLLEHLIQSLRCLPGVGQKSAQRMAFYLLQGERQGAKQLSLALSEATEKMRHCSMCRTYSEHDVCKICANPGRNKAVLCVVENPSDVWVLEAAGFFDGLYFVLHGRLSPLDGIGPDQLGMDLLDRHLMSKTVQELVLATNSTVEGEATAHFVAQLAEKHSITATRIAHGVPMGGELEYIDSSTLSHAFSGRKVY